MLEKEKKTDEKRNKRNPPIVANVDRTIARL